ncbi:methenyltetrahydrofolate cyclohydrolase [Kosmotoga arenicorallina S304]|uniref:Bifunctional protein FolD n=1 Tax=Kosmotoga arenicorallina S304 TaxID=1453497 RepID=A0A176K3W3_9BACT|nr:bifunctional 5,10-methylenetetrahydrofolate dehydrogenase/5,10-methenyltetrahydrofolate cyclohydrolase [Kosmotoga arenicorallina]OAA31721.1 methenyltetrahydrofolate cyclohydrolase [Kosmotoga arenicorallina S304]
MATILSGRQVSRKIYQEISEQISRFGQKRPRLVLYCSHPDNSTQAYMKSILKQGEKLNIPVQVVEASSQPFKDIMRFNNDPGISGVMVMHPLKEVDEDMVIKSISPLKDVEGRGPMNLGGVVIGETSYAPPTAEAVMEILNYYNIPIKGKDVTILGRSTTVGKPLAMLMLKKGVDGTVTVCHSRTKNIDEKARAADILVSAVGKAGFVRKSWVKDGAVVIDVGINFSDGKIVGDTDFDEVREKASAITPVPQGVGLVTTAVLFKHLVESFKRILDGGL